MENFKEESCGQKPQEVAGHINYADDGQRSKLLGFLLSNLQLNDKKLSFTVNYPYNQLIQLNRKPPEGGKNAVWCG